jgi:membrane protein
MAALRRRYEGSWVQDLGGRLKDLDVGHSITLLGSSLLLSVLPLIILLGALGNERIDDDLSRHIGLNGHAAGDVRDLFRSSPNHAVVPIATGLIIAFAGTMGVAGALQLIYERLFHQAHRGWRDVPRYVVWVAVLGGALIAEGVVGGPVRTAAGPVIRGLFGFVLVTAFFVWTMHFLLAGRVSWRRVIRPALATALLWLGVALLSSVYFSSEVISERRLYGAIGVVFTLATWLLLIGAVMVLGAACGAVWQDRAERKLAARRNDLANAVAVDTAAERSGDL